jgi:hypothetical protein
MEIRAREIAVSRKLATTKIAQINIKKTPRKDARLRWRRYLAELRAQAAKRTA